jgi:3-(3-hydroxy-phenyl)propionate hydroxylase
VRAFVQRHLDAIGEGHLPWQPAWSSVYRAGAMTLQRYRHGRVLLAGNAAHAMPIFGVRGLNSGLDDADNLGWKLAAVVQGGPEALLDSYSAERGAAADENLLNSTRSTDFMTPKSRAARVLRDAVLSLADEVPGVRALVNSGRLSVPTWLTDSPLNTPDGEPFEGWMMPGAPADDAPLRGPHGAGWLLDDALAAACDRGFVLLHFGRADAATQRGAAALGLALVVLLDAAEPAPGALHDAQGLAARRYDARPGTCYLIRPDQHVAARWRRFDAGAVRAALERATARHPG